MDRYRQIFVVLDFTFEFRNTRLLREKRLQLVMTILLPQRVILREETKSDVDILRERDQCIESARQKSPLYFFRCVDTGR